MGVGSNITNLLESYETIPVLVCLFFVLRLPARPKLQMSHIKRGLCFLPIIILLSFADLDFPESIFQDSSILMLIIVESLAIGVSEELTFRFGLFRLWSKYGPTFYVVFSSIIFGVLHFAGGIEYIIITGLVGVTFALARVAGAPILALIALHGFLDAPGIISRMGL